MNCKWVRCRCARNVTGIKSTTRRGKTGTQMHTSRDAHTPVDNSSHAGGHLHVHKAHAPLQALTCKSTHAGARDACTHAVRHTNAFCSRSSFFTSNPSSSALNFIVFSCSKSRVVFALPISVSQKPLWPASAAILSTKEACNHCSNAFENALNWFATWLTWEAFKIPSVFGLQLVHRCYLHFF